MARKGRAATADARAARGWQRRRSAPGGKVGNGLARRRRRRSEVVHCKVRNRGSPTLLFCPAQRALPRRGAQEGVARELREETGLSDALIRISIGIENVEDLISDLAQ